MGGGTKESCKEVSLSEREKKKRSRGEPWSPQVLKEHDTNFFFVKQAYRQKEWLFQIQRNFFVNWKKIIWVDREFTAINTKEKSYEYSNKHWARLISKGQGKSDPDKNRWLTWIFFLFFSFYAVSFCVK